MTEAEPQGQSIGQLVLDKAEEKMRQSQTYLPKDRKNVENNYIIFRRCMEKLPDKNYQSMGELIVALNRLDKGELFAGINSIIEAGRKRHKILAVFPPGTPMYQAYKDTPGATSFIGGQNLWDESLNQMLLPGVYILGPVASL